MTSNTTPTTFDKTTNLTARNVQALHELFLKQFKQSPKDAFQWLFDLDNALGFSDSVMHKFLTLDRFIIYQTFKAQAAIFYKMEKNIR